MFTIKQHDTLPPLVAILQEPDGTPLDLNDAVSVNLVVKSNSGAVTWKKSAVVVDADLGTVRYDWVSIDTTVADTYDAEFEVLWPAGLQTVPNDKYFQIIIAPDLG